MTRKGDQHVADAAAAFAARFPALCRQIKAISDRAEPGYDLASIIGELLRKPKLTRGRPQKRLTADDDHSMLASSIDFLVLAHKKSGASDPFEAAIEEATRLEKAEGRPKDAATIRKYYWQGRQARSTRRSEEI